MKKVLKFGTGSEVPEGAVYLCTIKNGIIVGEGNREFVWHYFLVDLK